MRSKTNKTRKLLSLLLAFVLCAMTAMGTATVKAADPVEVTGVGIFDQTPNKGMHDFGNGTKLIQVTFSDTFWSAAETLQWAEWEKSINDYLLINGKTPQEWVGGDTTAPEWGCISLNISKNAALGQYLEIFVNTSKGVAGLPTEDTDSTITIKAGFAGVITEDVTFNYTANSNAPYVEEREPVAVTGFGVFDQDPPKGIHTFDDGKSLVQVTFSDSFWNNVDENGEAFFLEWETSINNYLLINGKTPQELVGSDTSAPQWGSVMIHVRTNETLGQYLELNFSTYEGVPAEDRDFTITIKKGFAGVVAEDVTYTYTANVNVPEENPEVTPGTGNDGEQIKNTGDNTFVMPAIVCLAAFAVILVAYAQKKKAV